EGEPPEPKETDASGQRLRFGARRQSNGPRLRNNSVAQVASSAAGTTSAVGTPAVWCPAALMPAANAGAASTKKPTVAARPVTRRCLGLTAFPLVALDQAPQKRPQVP